VDLAVPRAGEEHWYPRPAIKLVGTVVGYAITSPSDPNEGEFITTIQRFDMRDVSEPGFVNYPSVRVAGGSPKIGSLVLRGDGAAAWIACPGRSNSRGEFKPTCDRPSHEDRVYALARKAKNPKLLSHGTRIAPHSLRRHGLRISWVQHGRRRSARL
jgi:hypothetical protein